MKIHERITVLRLLILVLNIKTSSSRIRGQTSKDTAAESHSYEYTSFIKGPGCQSLEPPRYPTTYQEVVSIVKEAIKKGVRVKAFGARHSSTDIICTDGIPIDMHRIRELSLDENNIVTVGAGVTVGVMTEFLMDHGRGLPILPAFQNITVGGAIGTGAHGSSFKYIASLSDQTIQVLIVDGLGNIRSIDSEEDLKAFRVHLGLLGIILHVKFKTIPLFKFRAHNYVMEEEILSGKIIDMGLETDQIMFHWFPSFRKVVVANWTRVDDPNTPGNAHTNALIPPTTASFNYFGKRAMEAAQASNSIQVMNFFQYVSFLALFKTVPDVLPIYTENNIHVINPAIGYYHRLSSVGCLNKGWVQCPWEHGKDGVYAMDNEMAIDIYNLPKFVTRVRDILSKSSAVFPFEGILIRFSGSSDAHMSLSRGRKTCHVEFYPFERKNRYMDPIVGMAAYQAIMQSLVNEFQGRSHWGKSGAYYHTTEQLRRKLDPSARSAFITTMKAFDPNGLFLNDFGRRLLGESTKQNWDPLVKHCALLDHCLCSSQNDCALGQNCSRIDGYPNYPVCLPKNQRHKTRLFDFSHFTIYYNQ